MKTLLCFLCFSATAWIWMAVEYVKMSRYKAKAKLETVETTGTIVAYEKKPRTWGRGFVYAYYPVIAFSVGMREYKVTSDYSFPELQNYPIERPPEGSEVVLYYNSSDPNLIHLQMDDRNNDKGHYRLGWYIIAASAVLSILCALIMKW